MSHYHDRFSTIELMQMLHNFFFIISVERVGGFVKEQKLRILIYGACYQQPLLLPTAILLAMVSEKIKPSCITAPKPSLLHLF